jgi:beta-aspartyl-peptidase (threonine type)
MTKRQRACLAEALEAGYDLLHGGGPAIAAVEAAIRAMEASGAFNAGVGSRAQLDGIRRMDASIMEGRDLKAGAVASLEGIRHPITAARLVMEKTAHVLLAGPQATRFARYFELEPLASSPGLRAPAKQSRGEVPATLRLYRAMARRRRVGLETVGAVALDRSGSLAAGASTGGIAVVLPGRVGDTPLIGCGVYADDLAGAVSMTGVGEGIIRLAVAKEIADRLAAGAAPGAAVRSVLARLAARLRGEAGELVLARDGRFAVRHTTPRMAAGWWTGRSEPVIKDKFER